MWPASQALYQSVLREDAFGLSTQFIGLENFADLFYDRAYLRSLEVTAVFSLSVALLALVSALYLAVHMKKIRVIAICGATRR